MFNSDNQVLDFDCTKFDQKNLTFQYILHLKFNFYLDDL